MRTRWVAVVALGLFGSTGGCGGSSRDWSSGGAGGSGGSSGGAGATGGTVSSSAGGTAGSGEGATAGTGNRSGSAGDGADGGTGGDVGGGDCPGGEEPRARDCTSSADNDCDGKADDELDSVCQCVPGTERSCQTHPEDGIGVCRAGSQTCELAADKSESVWTECTGSIGPVARDCGSAADNDCDGTPDNGTGGPTMVKLPEGYCIDSTEVTRAQYSTWLSTIQDPADVAQSPECAEWNTDFTPGSGWPPGSNGGLPVVSVDWCDAVAYCDAVGKRLCGKIGGGATDYSLFAEEDESQWYSACSSNGAYKYPYGSTLSTTACNTWESNNDVIRSAGSMQTCQPTTTDYRGVYDLVGNVAEWEDSCLGTGDSALCRLRGSSYLFDDFTTDIATCQADSSAILSLKMSDVGFRCCAP